jgi:hypothetical protein
MLPQLGESGGPAGAMDPEMDPRGVAEKGRDATDR